MRYRLEDSIEIARPAAQVFALVSDITRTGEWSPQCHACEWDGPERSVGATFTGHNRTPVREWSTVSRIVVDEPGVEFAWEVQASGTRWGYRLADEGGATLLTEYTVFGPSGEAMFGTRFGDDADTQMAIRVSAAAEGIPVTLRRIKEIAEA